MVVTETPAPSAYSAVWITDSALSARCWRQASQHDARSAYLDLKKGLLESLSAPVIFPCAFDSAAASSLMFSEVSIYSVLRSEVVEAVRLTRYVIQVLLVLCPPVVLFARLD